MENNDNNQSNQDRNSNPFMAGGLNNPRLMGDRAEDKQTSPAEEEPNIPEQTLFQWQAPEFSYTHKPIGWYLGVFAFFSGLIALAAWYRQWITIVLLVIMSIAISVWATRKPKILIYELSNYGINVEKRKYLFDDFRAYYKYMDYNQPTIDLVPAKRFGTLVSLPLATQDANEIEATIAQMIPVVEHKEDIADKIFRRLRF